MPIYIKGEQAEIFEITINDRLYPNNVDYWDGNFLDSCVKATINGFTASFTCNLRTDELNQWLVSIESFFQDNRSSISFRTMEENITVEGKPDSFGNIIWECVLKNSEDYSSVLNFNIKSSTAEIESLRNELKKLLKQYPILGKPY